MYYLLLGVIAVILSCHQVYCGLLNLNHWYILVSMVLCPTIEFLGGLLCPILGPPRCSRLWRNSPRRAGTLMCRALCLLALRWWESPRSAGSGPSLLVFFFEILIMPIPGLQSVTSIHGIRIGRSTSLFNVSVKTRMTIWWRYEHGIKL